MAFSGWPEEALDFYDGLAADNSKSYWTEHKAVYEDKILRPMTELTEELAAEFGEPKIFRPYRDVRFSRDKSPYKTHIGAVIGGRGYVQLSAEGLGAGAGMWQMSPEQLARYRAAVADDIPGGELEQIIARINKSRCRRARPRRAEVRAPRLPGRPPAGGPAAVQGRDQLEAMARRGLAGNCGGQGPHHFFSPNVPAAVLLACPARRPVMSPSAAPRVRSWPR